MLLALLFVESLFITSLYTHKRSRIRLFPLHSGTAFHHRLVSCLKRHRIHFFHFNASRVQQSLFLRTGDSLLIFFYSLASLSSKSHTWKNSLQLPSRSLPMCILLHKGVGEKSQRRCRSHILLISSRPILAARGRSIDPSQRSAIFLVFSCSRIGIYTHSRSFLLPYSLRPLWRGARTKLALITLFMIFSGVQSDFLISLGPLESNLINSLPPSNPFRALSLLLPLFASSLPRSFDAVCVHPESPITNKFPVHLSIVHDARASAQQVVGF